MAHGRNHQQREAHVRSTRSKNIPDSDTWPTKLLTSGRQKGSPPEGVLGPYRQRRLPLPDDLHGKGLDAAPPPRGSEVAPTRRAEERERLRHAHEREIGRVAAGTEGNLRDRRKPGSRAGLAESARRADQAVMPGSKKKARRAKPR